jgi:hypothetical protein
MRSNAARVDKLKRYIRVTSGMNTSDDVVAVLSDRVRALVDKNSIGTSVDKKL